MFRGLLELLWYKEVRLILRFKLLKVLQILLESLKNLPKSAKFIHLDRNLLDFGLEKLYSLGIIPKDNVLSILYILPLINCIRVSFSLHYGCLWLEQVLR